MYCPLDAHDIYTATTHICSGCTAGQNNYSFHLKNHFECKEKGYPQSRSITLDENSWIPSPKWLTIFHLVYNTHFTEREPEQPVSQRTLCKKENLKLQTKLSIDDKWKECQSLYVCIIGLDMLKLWWSRTEETLYFNPHFRYTPTHNRDMKTPPRI